MSTRQIPGRQEQLSTRIVFFIAGFGMAAWAPLVPFAKIRANIDDGMLGLLLLCLGTGSIVAMPLAGALAARLGWRLVLALSTGLICLTLPFLATVSAILQLVASLLIFGAGVGSLDVAMNIQAVIVERASGSNDDVGVPWPFQPRWHRWSGRNHDSARSGSVAAHGSIVGHRRHRGSTRIICYRFCLVASVDRRSCLKT